MEKRGRLLTPLGQTWQANNRSRDPERHALASWARAQHDGLLRRWVKEDREAKRNPDILTRERMADLWFHVDADT